MPFGFTRIVAAAAVALALVGTAVPGVVAETAPVVGDEAPAPIVIEGVDETVDVDDPALVASVAEMHASFEAGVTVPVGEPAGVWPPLAAVTSSGMSVSFDATHTPPVEVKEVVLAAVEVWDEALATTAAGPVVIAVQWRDLGSGGVLGSAGPNGLYRSGSQLPTSSWYPVGLYNTLLGTDRNGSSPEVNVNLNSAFSSWYVGTGTPPSGKIDLFSVVMHEIGHGLGFIGSASTGNHAGPDPTLEDIPFVFDEAVRHGGQPLLSLGNRNDLLRSGSLFIDIGSGLTEQLYAPGTWQEGSSFSHFDETANPAGTSGALMTPSIGANQVERTLDGSVLGVMSGMGWPLRAGAAPSPPPRPGIVKLEGSGLNRTVSWTSAGDDVTSYDVEWSTDGTTWTRLGTVTQLSYPVTLYEAVHQFRVRGHNAHGAGAWGYSIPTGVSAGVARPVALDGQLVRLYRAYFLRDPDPAGFGYWQSLRAGGATLADISAAFASSGEFVTQYGQLSNEQFVELIYQNVLGRSADQAGRAYWVGRLASGTSRGEVMTGFSESSEYVVQTGTPAPTSAIDDEVYRLYVAFFLRRPDDAGAAHWSAQRAGGLSLEQIADAFVASSEFGSTYGSLPDGSFVDLVYQNVLGRTADAGGRSYWVGQLGAGVSRAQMMVSFSESAEFTIATGTLP